MRSDVVGRHENYVPVKNYFPGLVVRGKKVKMRDTKSIF